MRYFIIAGEASGDLHGGGLVRELRDYDTNAEIKCWGGEHMKRAGATVLKHYSELAFMGFIEVLLNLPAILRNFRQVKSQITAFHPDALILIDYPGFNLRMAKWAHRNGIPVYYYISPQLWAWKEGRVETVRKYVSQMFVILPFERSFYERHGIEVRYVGHPLLEVLDDYTPANLNLETDKPLVAILAGSRTQEVKHMLPIMLEVAGGFHEYVFCIAAAKHVPEDLYKRIINRSGITDIHIVEDRTYDILSHATAALTTSGTATLETALLGVPQVVCYKGNRLSFQIARRLVKVPYISLVNLIAGRPVVEELIQDLLTAPRLSQSLNRILQDPGRSQVISAYRDIRKTLDEGGASQQTARGIINDLSSGDGMTD